MKKFIVLDNVLRENEQDYLEDLFLNEKLPWIYHKSTVIGEKTQSRDYSWFSHKFITSRENISEYTNDVLSIFKRHTFPVINIHKPYNMRANLLTHRKLVRFNHQTPLHKDQPYSHWVMIYYVNDSEGKTDLKEVTQVTPKKGRILIFDGDIEHRAFLPIKRDRCIINFNFLKY